MLRPHENKAIELPAAYPIVAGNPHAKNQVRTGCSPRLAGRIEFIAVKMKPRFNPRAGNGLSASEIQFKSGLLYQEVQRINKVDPRLQACTTTPVGGLVGKVSAYEGALICREAGTGRT